MKLLEEQEEPRRRFRRYGVVMPESGERAGSDRGKAVGLAPDVNDLFEAGFPTGIEEQMRQEEVGQVVHLPMQLVTIGVVSLLHGTWTPAFRTSMSIGRPRARTLAANSLTDD